MPPQEFDSRYEQLKQELPAELADLARQHKAFVRAREIKSPDQLLYLVFLYSVADLSLREQAGLCVGAGFELTDEAVRQRLRACPNWLEAILGKMLPSVELPERQAGWRIVICDGSQLSGPGAKGTDWRWHLAYDPVAQRVCQLHLSDAHTSESLGLYNLGVGDLVMGDRGYAKAAPLVQTRKTGAHLAVRLSPQHLKLWTHQGQAFDLVAALRDERDQTRLSFALEVRESNSGETIPVWVHAHHLNQQQINRARRRVKRKASRNSSTMREQTLFLSEWVLVLTTIPPEELSADLILELYRVRWQVELVIKRYKSLLNGDGLRARQGSPLAKTYLLGKLIFAVLVERRAIKRLGNEWTQMIHSRKTTGWRIWKLIAAEIKEAILNSAAWSAWDWKAILRALSERRRTRRLQVIPAEVARWLKTTPLVSPLQPG